MGAEIRHIHPLFAAEVSGVDLGAPSDAAAVGAIWEAIDRYAVLVFRDQHLDDEKLRDFAANFGTLEIGRAAAEARKRRLALPEIGDISNLDEEGRLRQREDRRRHRQPRQPALAYGCFLHARPGRARNALC